MGKAFSDIQLDPDLGSFRPGFGSRSTATRSLQVSKLREKFYLVLYFVIIKKKKLTTSLYRFIPMEYVNQFLLCMICRTIYHVILFFVKNERMT